MDDLSTTAPWVAVWVCGPDAGGHTRLGPGRHLLGRVAGCTIRRQDRALLAHHCAIDIDPIHGWRLHQLAGVAPVLIDGIPSDGTWRVASGTVIVGSSRLLIARPADALASVAPAQIRTRRVIRLARTMPTDSIAPIEAPSPHVDHPRHTTGLLPAALGLAGAAVIAVILRQPMFVLFGALGALMAVGSWLAQRLTEARHQRSGRSAERAAAAQFDRDVATQRDQLVAAHRHATVDLDEAVTTLGRLSSRLWQRRAAHADCGQVSLGLGELAVRLQINASPAERLDGLVTVADQPVAVRLSGQTRLAVRGPMDEAMGLVRALLLQLFASVGPADRRVVVVTDQPERWQWLSGVGHVLARPDGSVATPDELGELLSGVALTAGPDVVVVTDVVDELAARTSSVRRCLSERVGLIAILPADHGVPQICESAVTITHGGRGKWVADCSGPGFSADVHLAGISAARAASILSGLTELCDPDDPLADLTHIPTTVSMTALLSVAAGGGSGQLHAEAIAAGWLAAGPDPAPRTPIGIAADGLIDIDLSRDGPHGLLAGTTGSGKSELLRSLVIGLAIACPPEQLSMVLIDYKGGAAFDVCSRLPHVCGVVTDLDDTMADRALRSLHAELRRREGLLRQHRAADLSALRSRLPDLRLARLVVIVDEFAALAAEQPDFLHALVDIAQRGRSLGVHLLLATQRPAGVISDDIRANTNLRLALRLHDAADALDVVGVTTPASLARTQPGRAVLRLDADEHVVFQAAQSPDIDTLVAAVCTAADLLGSVRPPAPWRPPLPVAVDDDALAAFGSTALGLIDDPDRQATDALRWGPPHGSLLICGSIGSGVTSTLATISHHLAMPGPLTQAVHCYVIDAVGSDMLATLGSAPTIGGVVRIHETERLQRLIGRLGRTVRQRIATGGRMDDEPWIVLIVDGLNETRAALDETRSSDVLDELDMVLASGAHAGVVTVAGTARPSGIPASVASAFAHRWVLHLRDAHESVCAGLSGRQRTPSIPGRIILSGSELHAQLRIPTHSAALPDPPNEAGVRSRPAPIERLSTSIELQALPAGRSDDRGTELPIGVAYESLGVATLRIPPRSDVVVIGPPGSGRATALATMAWAWQRVHTGHRIIRLEAEPGSFDTRGADLSVACDAPLLIVVDNADQVDDTDGLLGALIGRRGARTTVAVSVTADGLRHGYGHWTTALRRSRLGLVASAANEMDGDLLGASLPRRPPIGARPGLFWLVDNGRVDLIQVARTERLTRLAG